MCARQDKHLLTAVLFLVSGVVLHEDGGDGQHRNMSDIGLNTCIALDQLIGTNLRR